MYPREVPGLLEAALQGVEFSWAVRLASPGSIIRGSNLEALCRLEFEKIFILHFRTKSEEGWPSDDQLCEEIFLPGLVSMSLIREAALPRPWMCNFHLWLAENDDEEKDMKRLYNRLKKVARQVWPTTLADFGVEGRSKQTIVSDEARTYFSQHGFSRK